METYKIFTHEETITLSFILEINNFVFWGWISLGVWYNKLKL